MTRAVTESDFVYVQRLLREDAGFVLEGDKQYLVETRLGPLVSHHGLGSIGELVEKLRGAPKNGLHRATIDAMMNGETTFFRDVFCFDTLRQKILPRLIARRAAERRLHVWCAACSTGQEPYSIAMLLEESFPELADWSVRVFATDISQAHLERARKGVYGQFEVNRGLPAKLLIKYFDQRENQWVIDPALRRRIEFAELNLMKDWPVLPLMDVVLLRNVMIYWDLDAKRRVLSRVRETMREDGYLVLGAAETTYYVDDRFDRVSAESACCFLLK